MSSSASITINLPYADIIAKLNGREFGLFEAQTVHAKYLQAMPFLTGAFSENIDFQPFEYTHIEPYSEYVYYSNGDFRKDVHAFSMARYIDGYASVAMPKIESRLQSYINRNIL